MRIVDTIVATSFMTDDRAARLAAAEATLTRVLSMAPDHALAHMLDGPRPNLHQPRGPGHRRVRACVGAGSKFGHRSRRSSVSPSMSRSRRRNRGSYPGGVSPQSSRYERLHWIHRRQRQALSRAAMRKRSLVASSIETNRNLSAGAFLSRRRSCASRSHERGAGAARAGLALNPSFTIRASAPAHRATIRPIWRSASASMKECARPGCRRDEQRSQAANSSSNLFASFRSSVSKPSVNQP